MSVIEDIRLEFLAQFSFYHCMKNQITENDFINKYLLTHEGWKLQKRYCMLLKISAFMYKTQLKEGQNGNEKLTDSIKSNPASPAKKIENLSETIIKLAEEARLSIQLLSKVKLLSFNN